MEQFLFSIMKEYGVVMILARKVLNATRDKNFRTMNIGHIILFCEGATEKYYFECLTESIRKDKFNDVVIEIESANGNSCRVLKFADKYLAEEKNNRKYSNYKKYLVFDCDSPRNIKDIINKMYLSINSYELLLSNCLFETWLLMHFENVMSKITKKSIYEKLSYHLMDNYEKANVGHIRKIVKNGKVASAIQNAEVLEKKYVTEKKSICNSIEEMNPYTNIYLLVDQLTNLS